VTEPGEMARAEVLTRSPLRVLHLAAPGPTGGLESVIQALATGHHARGLEVEVAAVIHGQGPDHPFLEPLLEAGVPVHPLFLPPRAYLRERREVARVIRARRPHVVHTHGHRPDILHAGLARRQGIPTVTTLHGSSRPAWERDRYGWLHNRLLRRFSAVIPVARTLVPGLLEAGVREDRIHVVPNARDDRRHPLPRPEARRVLGLPADAFVLGWIGRLIPIKGPDIFLEALTLLEDLSFTASIVGDGPELPRLEATADSAGIRDRLRFHGRVDGAARIMSAFDAFVLSSRSEGSPMVLFEAMAAGVPIVAARVGGVPDTLSDAEAVLVDPEDPVELAARLRDMVLGKVDLEARVARASERLNAEFTMDRWLERHEEIYERLAATAPADAPLP
jgi:glycosyltransferase involved in cell wall biosynthesis